MPEAIPNIFEPSPVFLWNLQSEAEICINQGGTSSGKTYSIMQALIIKAITNKMLRILVVGQDMPNLRIGPMQDFEIILQNPLLAGSIKEVSKRDNKYIFFTGSFIQFKTIKTEQDAKQGKREILFVNEANGIPFPIFDQLNVRTTERTFIDYNPTAPFWAHDLIGTEGVDTFFSNFEHNPFVSPKIIKKILRYYDTDPMRWKVYGLGQTGQVEGVIFENVNWIDSFPEGCKKISYGMDFGFADDPTTLVKTGWYAGQLFAELLLYEHQIGVEELKEKCKDLNLNRYTQINCDHNTALIRYLKSGGLNVREAAKGPGSINVGIKLLQSQKINIVANRHFKEEQQKYTYKYDSKKGRYSNVPIEEYNHIWDATRYSVGAKKKGRSVVASGHA